MSEIFNFLNKAESEIKPPIAKRKVKEVSPDLEEAAEESVLPLEDPDKGPEKIPEPDLPFVEKAVHVEAEICPSEQFDLTNSTPQIQSALDPLSSVGEEFRMLRTRLGLISRERGIRTLLVTSSLPDEGKTFTSCGLAGVFAQEAGKRILVIDADIRRPESGNEFGLNGKSSITGLAQVLEGKCELKDELWTATNPDFSFLPSGAIPSNPTELLSSPKLEEVLKEAAEKFDFVIIDSPPALALSDVTLLAPLCDATLLVVKANSTSSKLVTDTIDRIGKDRICGVILNQQKHFHTSKYYYRSYYRSSKKR